jgi:site-specific DNA-methyltransferase (adenine-specific)
MSGLFDGFSVPAPSRPNRLVYGDNLTIMRNMPSASVDLIYLDPPFNSQRNYNLIYKQMTGLPVPEQEEAFCDAWELDPEKEEMARRMPIMLREYDVDESLVQFWQAWITALRNTQPRLLAYLIYMTYRLFEMHRLLRPTGSIYLHCDPTASHYIKVIMDRVFGHQNFRNEIIWKRTSSHSDARRRFGDETDTILCFSKTDHPVFHRSFVLHSDQYIKSHYSMVDEHGRRFTTRDLRSPVLRPNLKYEYKGYKPHPNGWSVSQKRMEQLDAEGRLYFPKSQDGRIRLKLYLNESKGTPVGNIWDDIPPIHSQAHERLGYPTQKPIALLQRIIRTSSNEGDVVFDPFSGCGTAICAAHLNKWQWIGCDIAILSVRIVREVLLRRYGLQEGQDYDVSGVPLSIDGAHELFARDPRQFQHWAVELAGGFCSVKHSGDRGIDGRIYYETSIGLRSMVLSVKGGHLSPAYIRELRGTFEREHATELGGFICLEKPTKGMWRDVAEAGVYTYMGKNYDRLQIRTITDLLDGRAFDTPSRVQTMNWDRQIHLPL